MDEICALPGCTRLAFVEPTWKKHECCSKSHHIKNMILRSNGLNSEIFNGSQCQLSTCNADKQPGFDYCSKLHALQGMEELSKQITHRCRLPGCPMPAYIQKTSFGVRVHDFCGWSHATFFSMSKSCSIPPVDIDLSEKDLVDSLKNWIQSDKEENIIVDKDFFNKHPWQMMPQSSSCMYRIVPLRQNEKRVKYTTIEKCFWKQQGKVATHICSGVVLDKKNKTYMNRTESFTTVKFTAVEYTINHDNLRDWSVFKITRKAASEDKIILKSKKRKENVSELLSLLPELEDDFIDLTRKLT